MKLFKDADQILESAVQETSLPPALTPYLNLLTHPRRGWLKRDVHDTDNSVENAKQHVAKVVLAAESIDPQKWGISKIRLATQALVHELPEVLGTDWTPGEITEKAKFAQERNNLEELLPKDFPQRARIIKTWLEYESEKGLAYFLDKMDAVVTAEYYALTNPQYLKVADEFFAYGYEKVQDKTLREVLKQIQEKSRASKSEIRLTPGSIFPSYFNLLSNCQ